MRSLLLVCCLLFSQFSLAYSPTSHLPNGSRSSLIIQSLSSDNAVIKQDSSSLYPPASTLKLLTALATKLELGDDFYFPTTLERSGRDLIIRFSGDPTLTRAHLKQLFIRLKQMGTHSIDGNLWLDNSAFTGYPRAVGWPWDILGVCYSAPSTAITLDGNCIQASIYTQTNGSTRVHVPQHQPITVSSNATTVSKAGQNATQCDLELQTFDNNRYALSGCLVSRTKPLPLKFALQQPELYTQALITQILHELNMTISGDIFIDAPANKDSSEFIAEHRSEKLPQLLDIMLKKSNNLIADNLTKTLGAHFFVQPGSFGNGTQAIKQILFAKAGIDLTDAQLVDGSGLSRNNRITASDMSHVLHYIWENDQQLNLIKLMPVAGKNGTLKYRSSMRKNPISDQLIAKSGSLYGTYNMAGYGLNKNGQPETMFIQFVSDYFPSKSGDGKPVTAPITLFEQEFYRDVLKASQAKPKK